MSQLITLTVLNFPQRLRLMQIVGGFPAVGLPQLKAAIDLLQIIEFNRAEAELVGFQKDLIRDRLTWDAEQVALQNPLYELQLTQEQAVLLVGIIEQHKQFNPSTDGFLLALVANLKAGALEGMSTKVG